MHDVKLNEPSLSLAFAPSGYGKTTDLCYSFPRFLFIAMPGGLTPAETVCGYRPARMTNARTFDDLITIVQQEAEKKGPDGQRKWDGIVLDDFSLMSDASLSVMEQNCPTTRSGTKDMNAFWGLVRAKLLTVRNLMVSTGMHFICNAHERGPHNDERKGFVPGGPMLPGTMPADMPKTFSAVLRVRPADGLPVWPYVYTADENDTQWVTKNRYGLYGNLPMNLGEMLRLFYGTEGKFGIRRLASLPWQEEMVEKIATKLKGIPLEDEAHKARRQDFKAALFKKFPGVDPKHVAWTIRDGMHRAILRELYNRSILERY